MKAIILAGGSNTRLYPTTKWVSKSLLPVLDKPLLYYPISIAMLAGCKDICLICAPKDKVAMQDLATHCNTLGLDVEVRVQAEPKGIPQAYVIAEDFIGDSDILLILGDNILLGNNLTNRLIKARKHIEEEGGANIFCYHVPDPERYGVAVLEKKDKVVALKEKPKVHISPWAITGIYMTDNDAIRVSKELPPSARGETEIVDLLSYYHSLGRLKATTMRRGYFYIDAGTPESLFEASNYVKIIQESQNTRLACIEEIALKQGLISQEEFESKVVANFKNSPYANYLKEVKIND